MWKRTISSKIYLWNKTRSGACAVPVPLTRAIDPGPNLRRRRLLLHSSFRMLLGRTGREPTGAMKTKKRAAERMHSLTASFLSFSPDAKHPVGGVPPPARGRQCRSQLAKSQCSFCKGVSACSCGAPNSQKHIRSLQKYVCMLLCFTGTLFARYTLQYPVPGQGAMPLVGGRGKAPQVSPSTTGKLFV